jgi:Na+-driven multidrug efflux pump
MALTFIQLWQNELSSVWWSISISSILKGTILSVLFLVLFKAFIREQKEPLNPRSAELTSKPKGDFNGALK